jgi:enamine deaminase RidA (YjgF/YER057c/UK114 family)
VTSRFGSGSPYEARIGYSRVVAAGPWIVVAGCTSTVEGTVTGEGDAAAQARTAFGIALDAIRRTGAGPDDVIRTRMYVVNRADADAVGAVHAELFGAVRPVATMVVVAGLIDPRMLVEVELDAYRERPTAAPGSSPAHW